MEMEPDVQHLQNQIQQQNAHIEQQHANFAQLQAQQARHAAQWQAEVAAANTAAAAANAAAHGHANAAAAANANAAAANTAAAAAAQNPAAGPHIHEGMPRGYRPEGPPKFHGRTGEDVEAWLFQLEESNRLFPITDEHQRIRYVALSLRETASRWYTAMQMSEPPQITDWESFTTKLRQQFVHLDQRWVARNSIHSLKQMGSVRDYSVKFRNLQIQIPDMSAPDALDRYVRGLKDFAWKVWRRKFTTLEEAMAYAEELDLEIQQKHVLNRGSNFRRDKPLPEPRYFQHDYRDESKPVTLDAWLEPHRELDIPRSDPHDFQRRFEPQSPSRDAGPDLYTSRNEPTPMELGVLSHDLSHPDRTGMTDTERARHMLDNLCFYCHKPGHQAVRCPEKHPNSEWHAGRYGMDPQK
jgi:hypothetical protein